jgi:guanylate kinase
MQNGKLIVFSAPSGAGKTTLVKHLLAQTELNLAFSISATSRMPRAGEIDGKDYCFLSETEFKNRIEKDLFLEWEEVYAGNFYGTLKTEVERLWTLGKNVVFDIDVVGGLNIKAQFPNNTLSVFIAPPSIETLKERLESRATETEAKIKMRLDKAAQEMATAPKFDVIIKNIDLATAKKEAFDVIAAFLAKS